METTDVWNDCLKLLAYGEQPYVTESHLIHFKDDSQTLINMFRLYSVHHVTKQLVQLGAIARKYSVKGIALPGSILEKEGDENDDSDYCDDDFKDLMSIKQIQQSIKVFYDRLKELMNPIDEDRLKLDSVHQVKATVKDFYQKKSS